MTGETAAVVSGALFWLIIATNVASNRFGYQTFGDPTSEAKLDWVAAQPRSFAIGVTLILIEHVCIVLLAVSLFVAFGQLNLALGIAWLVFRSTEGIIQIANKRFY